MARVSAPPPEDIRNYISYDPDTGHFTRFRKLHNKGLDRADWRASNGYYQISHAGRCYSAQRLAWFLHYGEWPVDFVIDHINRDLSDNRICNLRLATLSQNNMNRMNTGPCLKGVHYCNRTKKFVSKIWVGRRMIGLGYFDDQVTAHDAYREAATEHFGEFARFA